MIQLIETINTAVNNFVWGVPAMVCIIGVGLYLSIRTHFLQIRKFPYAIKTTLGRMFRKRDASDGALTPFQAVCTALAATVGTGNVAGVAGAIAIGGPGAVFWMWISAVLGMCIMGLHFHHSHLFLRILDILLQILVCRSSQFHHLFPVPVHQTDCMENQV